MALFKYIETDLNTDSDSDLPLSMFRGESQLIFMKCVKT